MLLEIRLTATFCREEGIWDQVPIVLVAHSDSYLGIRGYLRFDCGSLRLLAIDPLCSCKYTKV